MLIGKRHAWAKLFVLALACLLLCIMPLPAKAQIIHPETKIRDYVDRKDVPQGAGGVRQLKMNRAQTNAPAASLVEYTSFTFGVTYRLNSFEGRYVRYLISDSALAAKGFSADEMRKLLDQTDLLYAHMAELIEAEPQGAGLLTIALLDPGYDFGGRGFIGAKGVEVYAGYVTGGAYNLSTGTLPNAVVHEMSHNFDLFHYYIGHDGDSAHSWTAFLIPYSQYYARTAIYQDNADYWLSRISNSATEPWDASASATWTACVRDGFGCEVQGVDANSAWSGFLFRFALLHRQRSLRGAFSYLREYAASHPAPLTPDERNDLLNEALAAGTGLNIICEIDAWKWNASGLNKLLLAERYPAENLLCLDRDEDGSTPLQVDRDDLNSQIFPGAIEIKNGVDDNCNYLIDETSTKHSPQATTQPLQPVLLKEGRQSKTGTGLITATVTVGGLKDSGPLMLRLWAEGSGFVLHLPLTNGAVGEFSLPSTLSAVGLRAQITSLDGPAATLTTPLVLRTPGRWQVRVEAR